MTTGLSADPVEILLNLVRDGELDPWDIDIIEITDRFLSEIDRIDSKALARSARCLFYASALVHLKAQALSENASAQVLLDAIDDGFDDFYEDFGEGARRCDAPLYYPRKDRPLVPRERRPRGRSLTLNDLLDALRRLDENSLAGAESELYDDPWDVPFDDDTLDVSTAHEDDLEGDILQLREVLRERFAAGETQVALEQLSNEELSCDIAYRALLFLAHDGEIELEQEEIYGPLFVSPGAEPLREISEEQRAKRQDIEERREQKTRRSIPRPNKRGRKLSRRPGLAPPAHARRPKARRRVPRANEGKAKPRSFDELAPRSHNDANEMDGS